MYCWQHPVNRSYIASSFIVWACCSAAAAEALYNPAFSVSVSCSHDMMQMSVDFDKPFGGRVLTRPNTFCSVNGEGRTQVQLQLLLDGQSRQQCGIVQVEGEYVALVGVEINPHLITHNDNTYFVRCPIHQPVIYSSSTEAQQQFVGLRSLEITEQVKVTPLRPQIPADRQTAQNVKEKIVDQPYQARLIVPANFSQLCY
uniref:ZP domain-containing protein n=1 Tax=Ditylenchus dipsaci TaxID=166011 RepID=A0A915E8R7_9BILA